MFLFKLLFAPIIIFQIIVRALMRTVLIALVAFAVVGSARIDASGGSMLDRGIDQLTDKIFSLDSKALIRASSGWYAWALNRLPSSGPTGCP